MADYLRVLDYDTPTSQIVSSAVCVPFSIGWTKAKLLEVVRKHTGKDVQQLFTTKGQVLNEETLSQLWSSHFIVYTTDSKTRSTPPPFSFQFSHSGMPLFQVESPPPTFSPQPQSTFSPQPPTFSPQPQSTLPQPNYAPTTMMSAKPAIPPVQMPPMQTAQSYRGMMRNDSTNSVGEHPIPVVQTKGAEFNSGSGELYEVSFDEGAIGLRFDVHMRVVSVRGASDAGGVCVGDVIRAVNGVTCFGKHDFVDRVRQSPRPVVISFEIMDDGAQYIASLPPELVTQYTQLPLYTPKKFVPPAVASTPTTRSTKVEELLQNVAANVKNKHKQNDTTAPPSTAEDASKIVPTMVANAVSKITPDAGDKDDNNNDNDSNSSHSDNEEPNRANKPRANSQLSLPETTCSFPPSPMLDQPRARAPITEAESDAADTPNTLAPQSPMQLTGRRVSFMSQLPPASATTRRDSLVDDESAGHQANPSSSFVRPLSFSRTRTLSSEDVVTASMLFGNPRMEKFRHLALEAVSREGTDSEPAHLFDSGKSRPLDVNGDAQSQLLRKDSRRDSQASGDDEVDGCDLAVLASSGMVPASGITPLQSILTHALVACNESEVRRRKTLLTSAALPSTAATALDALADSGSEAGSVADVALAKGSGLSFGEDYDRNGGAQRRGAEGFAVVNSPLTQQEVLEELWKHRHQMQAVMGQIVAKYHEQHPNEELPEYVQRTIDVVVPPTISEASSAEHVLMFGDNDDKKEVRGGTLVALVEYLTSDETLDTNFKFVFLLTYRSFVSGRELTELLISRFVSSPMSDRPSSLQLKVVSIFKTWIDTYFHDFEEDEQLLAVVIAFIQFHIEPHEHLATLAQQLTRAIKRKLDGQEKRFVETGRGAKPKPITKLRKSKTKSSLVPIQLGKREASVIFDFNSLEVARQLTLISSKVFRDIKPKELLNQSWTKANASQRAPNIFVSTQRFNLLCKWVQETILSEPDLRQRTNLVTYFIEVAHHCVTLQNFNDSKAIHAAFDSASIYRLKKTFGGVSKEKKEMLATLGQVLSSEKNSAAMRARLAALQPPCVPFLGMFLSDLVFIEDGNKNMIPGHPNVINFNKRRKIADVIRQIQQLQPERFELEEVENIQLMLTSLNTAECNDEELHQMSLKLEPREKRN